MLQCVIRNYNKIFPINFEQKKEVFVKPGLSALTSGLSITGNTLVDAVLGGEVLNCSLPIFR